MLNEVKVNGRTRLHKRVQTLTMTRRGHILNNSIRYRHHWHRTAY
jgi:hypothetical protein